MKEDKDGRRKQAGGSAEKEGKAKKKDLFLFLSVVSRITATVSDGSSSLVPLLLIATFQTRWSAFGVCLMRVCFW